MLDYQCDRIVLVLFILGEQLNSHESIRVHLFFSVYFITSLHLFSVKPLIFFCCIDCTFCLLRPCYTFLVCLLLLANQFPILILCCLSVVIESRLIVWVLLIFHGRLRLLNWQVFFWGVILALLRVFMVNSLGLWDSLNFPFFLWLSTVTLDRLLLLLN